jgi:hypothetical protein
MFELGGEPSGRGRKRTWAAIRIIRCSDDEQPRMQRTQLALDGAPIRSFLCDRHRGERSRRRSERVTRGDSYSFQAEIECNDRVNRAVTAGFDARASYPAPEAPLHFAGSRSSAHPQGSCAQRISSMAGDGTKAVDVDSHQPPCPQPALFERQLENDSGVHRHGQPRILTHLPFELT